jgi:hypothetical protein
MANDFYTKSGNPATQSNGASSTIRNEFTTIEQGFDKMPALTGNGGKVIRVNAAGNALEPKTLTELGGTEESLWCGTAGGTANALTLTPAVAITAYAAGQAFRFKSGASVNTGAATVNISGVGAIAIQRNGAALNGGEIEASQWYQLVLSDATTAQLTKIGKARGLDFNGAGVGLAINQTLSPADVGKWLEVQSAGLTITLPPVANVETGDSYTLKAQHPFTLAADGAELIHSTATAATTLSLADDEYLTIASNGSAWYVVSRSYNYAADGSAKLWLRCNGAGVIADSFNITSIGDVGVGELTVTIATDFASVNYAALATLNSSSAMMATVLNQAAGSFKVESRNDSGTLSDPLGGYCISAFGDQ